MAHGKRHGGGPGLVVIGSPEHQFCLCPPPCGGGGASQAGMRHMRPRQAARDGGLTPPFDPQGAIRRPGGGERLAPCPATSLQLTPAASSPPHMYPEPPCPETNRPALAASSDATRHQVVPPSPPSCHPPSCRPRLEAHLTPRVCWEAKELRGVMTVWRTSCSWGALSAFFYFLGRGETVGVTPGVGAFVCGLGIRCVVLLCFWSCCLERTAVCMGVWEGV